MVFENPMFRIAWKNFRRRRIRSVITILSIMLAIACFVVIVSVEDTISAQITSFHSGRQPFPFFSDFIVVEANRWVRTGIRPGRVPISLVEELKANDLVDVVAVRIGTPDDNGEQLILRRFFGEMFTVVHPAVAGLGQTTYPGFLNVVGIDPQAESMLRTPRINQTSGLPYWERWEDLNASTIRGKDAVLETNGTVGEKVNHGLNGELSFYVMPPERPNRFNLSIYGEASGPLITREIGTEGFTQIPRITYKDYGMNRTRGYLLEVKVKEYSEETNAVTLQYRLWFSYAEEDQAGRQREFEISYGEYLDQENWKLASYQDRPVYAAIIGVEKAFELKVAKVGPEDGDLILLPGGTEGSSGGAVKGDCYLRVVGVYASSRRKDNGNVYMHYRGAMEMLNYPEDYVQETVVTVVFDDDDNIQRVRNTAQLAQEVASRRDLNTQIPKLVVREEGGVSIVAEQVKTTQLAHLQSVVITLAVAVIVVMNATVLSIYERVREVGIMGAMGSEVWHIMDMYVFELLIIGLLGGMGGYLIGTLMSFLTHVLPGVPNIPLKVNPLWIMASVSIGTLVSVAAGIFPARLAGTLDPIKAIAGEWAISPSEGAIFGTISRSVKRSYYAAMAARNLGKRKLRSVLTSLGVTVGIGMLVNLLVISAFQRQLTPGYSVGAYQIQAVVFAIVVGALGITNAMLTSVLERTKEIGIMVAVGATPGEVMKVFLSEAGIIGAIGGVLGCALGTATSLAFLAGRKGLNLPLEALALGWIAGILLAVAVAVVAGIYPSRRAAKMEPVEAFKYEW